MLQEHLNKPEFLSDKKATGVDRGNAFHKFMEFCDLESARNNFDGEVSVLRVQGERCASERARNAVGISNGENTDNGIFKGGKPTAISDRFACGNRLNMHNICRKMHNRLQF